MSPQAHARVYEKYFEIVGPTFLNTIGEFRKLFEIFESFCNGGKVKFRDELYI